MVNLLSKSSRGDGLTASSENADGFSVRSVGAIDAEFLRHEVTGEAAGIFHDHGANAVDFNQSPAAISYLARLAKAAIAARWRLSLSLYWPTFAALDVRR